MKLPKISLEKGVPFTIEEICERFDQLYTFPQTHTMVEDTLRTRNEEVLHSEEGYKVGDTEGTIDKKILKRVNTISDFGQQFTLQTWVGRAFKNYRYAPYVEGMFRQDYLHTNFKWWKTVERGGFEYDPDVGKTKVVMNRLCRHWLSDMFGFYNYDEMVVQVNPIEIFFLQFIPEEQRRFAPTQVRIIGGIEELNSEWAFNRFEYYMNALTGGRHCKPLAQRGVKVMEYAETDHGERLRSAQYLKGRGCMKSEVLEHLRPLGQVVNFGKSVQLECWMAEGVDGKPVPLEQKRREVEAHPRNQSGDYRIFSNGWHVYTHTYDINPVVDKHDLSKSAGAFQDYFLDLARKQNPGPKSKKNPIFRSIGDMKDDIEKNQFFDSPTIRKKKFVTEFLMPKLRRMGFEVREESRRQDGKNIRTLILKAPTYGRKEK